MKKLSLILFLILLFLGLVIILLVPSQTENNVSPTSDFYNYSLQIKEFNTNAPIINASVTFLNETYYSDSQGNLLLSSQEKTLAVEVKKTGYYSLKTSISSKQNIVELKKLPENRLQDLASTNSLFSQVFYFRNEEPGNGLIKIYSESNLLLGENQSENGVAFFGNTPTTNGYATVEENGTVLDKQNYFLPSGVILSYNDSSSSETDSTQTIFYLTPENSSADLQVFDSNQQLVFEGTLSDTLNLTLKSGFYFYTAFNENQTVSKRFEAGGVITIDFTPSLEDQSTVTQNDTTTENNTVNQKTNAFTLTLKSDESSSITLFHNNQKIIEKTFQGKFALNLDKGIYYLKAFNGNKFFEKTIELNNDLIIPISYSKDLTYSVSLTDGLKPVNGKITITSERTSTSCDSFKGECIFSLKPSTYLVQISSPGFDELNYSLELSTDFYDKITLVKNYELLFKGAFQNGFRKTELVAPGTYDLEFQVTGGNYLLFSVDSDKLSISNSNLFKFGEFYSSFSSSDTSSNCFTPGKKEVLIKIPDNINELFLSAAFSSSSREETLSFDYSLVDSLDSCKQVIKRNAQLLLKASKNSSQEVEAKDNASNDFFLDKDVLKTNVKKFSFKMDAVFPGDSLTLTLPDIVSFRMEGPNAKCFSFKSTDVEKNLIALSNVFDSSCNILVYENKLSGLGNNNVIFSYKTQELKIPIEILFNKIKSIYYDDVTPYYSSKAKLFPLISNRQYSTDYFVNDKKISFEGPKARFLVLNQLDNTYFVKDSNQENLFQLNLQKTDSFFDYDSICKTESKNCYTGFCCLTTCCTQDQTDTTLTKFKQTARDVAVKTAFRRGNGKPFKLISKKQAFEFYTVVSKKKGVSLKLEDSIDLPSFQVVVYSSDGSSEQITSETGSIDSIDYYSGKCSPVSLEGFSLSDLTCVLTSNESNADLDQENDNIKVNIIRTSFPLLKDPLYACSASNLAKLGDLLGLPGSSKAVCDSADKTVKYVPYLETSSEGSLTEVIPRTTFARCFQPDPSLPCKPICRSKSALNLIQVKDHQYTLYERDGVSSYCTIVKPKLVFSDNYTVKQLRDLLKSQDSNSLLNNYDTIVLTQSLCDYGFDFKDLINGLYISDVEALKLYYGALSGDFVSSFIFDAAKSLCDNTKSDVNQLLANKYFPTIPALIPTISP